MQIVSQFLDFIMDVLVENILFSVLNVQKLHGKLQFRLLAKARTWEKLALVT